MEIEGIDYEWVWSKTKIYTAIAIFGSFVILGLLFYVVVQQYSEFVNVYSGIDNRRYRVLRSQNKEDQKRAADTLARINQKVLIFRNHLMRNPNPDFQKEIENLQNKYNPDHLSEASNEIGYDISSYTVNKGEEIGLCLKCRGCDESTFEPENTLMYVMIHELSHVANDEEGHGKRFQEINKYFTKEASKSQVWLYRNYEERPAMYCGVKIDENLI